MRRRCEQYGLWSSFAAFPEKEGGIQLLSAATKFSETFRVRKNTDVVSLSPSLSHSLSPFHELLDSSQFEQDMESDPAETSVSSRWNPTKEQITMLESLYRQGIRTPSAEQIQHITSRLRAYGHIKGKNVFYWFQNHKARQRQKQKQESMAHIDRFFHRAQPIFPLCKNVTCGPYFLPQSDIGFYPQYCHPKVLLTGGIRRRPRTEKVEKSRAVENAGRNTTHQEYHTHTGNSASEPATIDSKKTLPLFPLHPTGIVQGKTGKPLTGSPAWNSPNPGLSEVEEASGDQRLFDFFSGRGFCEIG